MRRGFAWVYGWGTKDGGDDDSWLALFMCETGIVFESEKREMASLKGSRRGQREVEEIEWRCIGILSACGNWQYLSRARGRDKRTSSPCKCFVNCVTGWWAIF
jgi:hypothetical protein